MDIIKDIKELSMAAGIADTFHGRDCCSALDRLEDYIEELRKERDEYKHKYELTRAGCINTDIKGNENGNA